MTDSPSSDRPQPNPSEKPRILIIGSAGQLGRELERIFTGVGPIVAVDRDSVDLADPDQLREVVRRAAPDVILNAAAYTAVDRAESEMALAHAINALAPRVLAEEAAARNALLVHYSTDYVFDGSKQEPWTEETLLRRSAFMAPASWPASRPFKTHAPGISSSAPVGSMARTATTFCSPCCAWLVSATSSPSLTTR